MLLFKPLTERLATLLSVALALATFVFDWSQPLGIAGSMPYVVLPLVGLLARSSWMVIAGAVVGSLLTIAGMALSEQGGEFSTVIINRVMSITLIWVAACAALRHLAIGRHLNQQLRQQALTDPLTGLFNRRHVFACIDRELRRYLRYAEAFSIILIDADHFKHVNDNYGHSTGDATLRLIARVCQSSVRETDIVGRFGGEEFIILLPHTKAAAAAVVAERIRCDMRTVSQDLLDGAVLVTLSLGITEVAPDTASFDKLLATADKALYAAKAAGRDRVVVTAAANPGLATVNAA
ncbi:MAG: GGDEF domain-containing protein [Woeseia sp.]